MTEERRNARILDVGCGTGLLASCLRARGFNRVDGLDYSAPMLAVAQREGRIDQAFLCDLNERLEMETECYGMLASTGTFTPWACRGRMSTGVVKTSGARMASSLYGAPRYLG